MTEFNPIKIINGFIVQVRLSKTRIRQIAKFWDEADGAKYRALFDKKQLEKLNYTEVSSRDLGCILVSEKGISDWYYVTEYLVIK